MPHERTRAAAGDANGNIDFLKRYGKSGTTYNIIDQLSYFYNGNQLIGVNDLAPIAYAGDGFDDSNRANSPNINDSASLEYEYDDNGNLIKDVNKNITDIDYNQLNLPQQVTISEKGRIEYLYDAAGIKLRQKVFPTGASLEEINYIGNFVYKDTSSLKFILVDEGRIVPKAGGGFDYEYFIKDHLGNTRLTLQDSSGLAAVKQEDHYYPFGMVLGGQSYQASTGYTKNDYLYNGKEMQDELGLEWYDYGARFYDAQIGRWHSVDALTERDYSNSPYIYVSNNPLKFIDPDGPRCRTSPLVWQRSKIIFSYGNLAKKICIFV